MKYFSEATRTTWVWFLSSVTVLVFLLLPAVAGAAPQEPWVLPATDLSAAGQTAQEPQVAIGPDGNVTVVWVHYNGTNWIIQSSTRPPGGDFSVPQDLSTLGQSAFSPQVATGPDGSTTVVWNRYNGTNYIIQSSTRSAGGAFSIPQDLSAPGQNAFNAQVATGPDGTVTVVWYRFNGTNNIIQATTRPPGGDFVIPKDLSAPGQYADGPQVATGPDGTVAVVWYRYNGTNYIIQARTRSAGGAFSIPQDLSAPGQNAGNPQVATGPDGTVTAVWAQYNGTNWIIQARTRPPGGPFGTPQELSAPGQNAGNPQIAASPDSTVTVVWSRIDGTNSIIQSSTRPPGGDFETPQDLSATGQNAYAPQVATGADGGATATWLHSAPPIIAAASTRQPSPALNVTRSGNGQGTISSNPAGISCGTTCSKDYPSYTKVTLTATADPGSSFNGWNGACSGTSPTCEVTMLDTGSVNAEFTLNPLPPPNCRKANLKLGRFKANRKHGTGTLKVRAGTAGKVTLKGSHVKSTSRGVKRKGTVRLKVKAKGKAARKLRRNGSVKLKLKVTFRPKNGCKTRTRTKKIRLAT